MVPITLVTGFLGSGKTTLLRQIARQHPDKNFVFLVNEFSPRGIDPKLLSDTGIPIIAVEGGSIFCQCKVGDFLAHLRGFPERFHTEKNPIDGLFIETSGLADPRAIHRLLKETQLDSEFSVRQIITIVVAARFLAIVNTLPVVRAQIETADKIILNKLDISDPDNVKKAIRMMREINPSAPVIQTSQCDTKILIAEDAKRKPISGELTVRANPYSTFELPVEKIVDPLALSDSLEKMGSSVYRAKGILPRSAESDGWLYFDWTQDGWSANPVEYREEQGILVILVSDAEEENLATKIKTLALDL
jgi:G3E family GTPase